MPLRNLSSKVTAVEVMVAIDESGKVVKAEPQPQPGVNPVMCPPPCKPPGNGPSTPRAGATSRLRARCSCASISPLARDRRARTPYLLLRRVYRLSSVLIEQVWYLRISNVKGFLGFIAIAVFVPSTWAVSACDLNQDGSVNVVDVQLATNMTLGLTPCTADVYGSDVCNVIVIQRVTNAALGGTCVTGTSAVSHSVTLSWLASSTTGVTGYNVYRGTTTGGPVYEGDDFGGHRPRIHGH